MCVCPPRREVWPANASSRAPRLLTHAPRLAVCFAACDTDGNGVIDGSELEVLLDAGLVRGAAATAMIKVRMRLAQAKRLRLDCSLAVSTVSFIARPQTLVTSRARFDATEGVTLAEFEASPRCARARASSPG